MANNNDKFISRENAKTLWGYMIDLLTGKQNKLTFDETPTQSSDNPVKSGGIFTALAGKGTYSKPQNGIPKTDLENAVQTSLGLADSALQSETDPTVPSWAKQTNKPSYTQDEVGDGTTYKRVNQTEKDTWSGKQNALNTTQMQAVNSGITSAGVTQIGTNQSNALYAINTGVKNALVVEDRESSGSGTIKFSAKNGVVTVTGPAGSNTSFFSFNFTGISGRFKLNGCPSGGSDNTYLQRIYTADGSIAIAIDRGSGTAEFTLDPNVTYQWTIRIQANYAIQNSLVFRPMLYQADTDGSTFQTGALPNYDLTRLEAEDRAALIEQVDSGAKNKLNCDRLKSAVTDRGITFTPLSDGTIKATGTNDGTGNSVVLLRVSPPHEFDGMIISGLPVTDSYAFFRVQRNATPWDGTNYRHNAQIGSYSYETLVYAIIDQGTALPSGGVIFKPMLCTLADWKVSQKFVPYLPDWNSVGVTVKSLWTDTFSDVSAYSDNVSNIEGGYSLIGKLVVVNIRCTLSPDVNSWIILITGLPKPSVQYNTGNGAVCLAINKGDSAILTGQGSIGVTGNISSGETLLISGTYIAY